jgi:hypothetical protein
MRPYVIPDDRARITSVGELRKNLKKLKPGDAAVLEVERQGVVRFVAFEME